MISTLGTAKLKNGEVMTVKLLTPPEPEYADEFLHFLEHKSGQSQRGIRQRLEGKYTDFFRDRYFIGEIAGRSAGQLWYGYAMHGAGIGNFGHVYTEPEHRGKGVVNRLMDFFLDDFKAGKARAVLCSAGQPWVARIYLQRGFQPVIPGTDRGPLILLRDELAGGFREFADMYFKPGQPVRIAAGSMEYRHDADLMLRNALRLNQTPSQRLDKAFMIGSYQDACFLAEDGKGLVTVATTPEKHLTGWAFVLRIGAPAEKDAPVFDFEIHPDYLDTGAELTKATCQLAGHAGISTAYAFANAGNTAKLAALHAGGFTETARLPAYLRINDKTDDMLILRAKLG